LTPCGRRCRGTLSRWHKGQKYNSGWLWTLIIDFTPVVAPRPVKIKSANGELHIRDGVSVAIGHGNSILEEHRVMFAGRPRVRDK
jgi:hypothetical protein